MKTPKKKEVVKYFENAKEVESVFGNKFILGEIYISDSFGILGRVKGKTNVSHTIWNPKQGYAKILSYKEPKEKTYKITREQIIELCMPSLKTNRERFELIFPEVFETKLTVGKWYKFRSGTLALYQGKNKESYGFHSSGKYFEKHFWFADYNSIGIEREATEQEVMMALNKECERLGIKTGAYIKDVVTGEIVKIDDNYRYYANNCLKHLGHVLFHNGQFAEVVPTLTIKEAEAKLNCKIV